MGAALLAGVPGYARAAEPASPVQAFTTVLAGQGTHRPSGEAVRVAVERAFDVDEVGRGILAGMTQAATPQQLVRFRRALTGRIARDLYGRLRPGRQWTIAIVQTRAIRPEEWLVTSRITVIGQGARTIAWRVRSHGGLSAIVDVLGNGTSMVRVLHDDYDTALRRFGLDGVIERMEASAHGGQG